MIVSRRLLTVSAAPSQRLLPPIADIRRVTDDAAMAKLTNLWHRAATRFVGRRKAAFLVGVLAGTPVVIFATARAYAESPTKGWIIGLSSYAAVVAAALYTAISYDRRYSDRDNF